MAEGSDSNKTRSKRGRRVQASWNIRPSSGAANSGRAFARPGQNNFQFVAPGTQSNNNNTPNAGEDADDDDLDWVPPTSGHNMSVVDLHQKNLISLGYMDLEDWLQNPDHVYIGRDMTKYIPGAVGSKWGNPFKSRKLGRAECCNRYKEYVKRDRTLHDDGNTLRRSLDELKGKTVGCWCHPKRCHGHMLVELVNELC